MKKKLLYSLTALLCLGALFVFFSLDRGQTRFASAECPFCKPSILDYQKFYEDEFVLALYTHKPILPGHCLVIPKRHVERFDGLSPEEASQIFVALQQVNRAVEEVYGTSSYLLLQKNGLEVGQQVPHVHFHYIPRKEGDDSTFKFLFKMFSVNAKKPIRPAEMAQAIYKLKNSKELCQAP